MKKGPLSYFDQRFGKKDNRFQQLQIQLRQQL